MSYPLKMGVSTKLRLLLFILQCKYICSFFTSHAAVFYKSCINRLYLSITFSNKEIIFFLNVHRLYFYFLSNFFFTRFCSKEKVYQYIYQRPSQVCKNMGNITNKLRISTNFVGSEKTPAISTKCITKNSK